MPICLKKKIDIFYAAIIALFFLFLIMQALYYYLTIASITKDEQNLAIEMSSLEIAARLSQELTYKVYVGATGRYQKVDNKNIKVIDVYYLFNGSNTKTSVDLTNKKIIGIG